MSWRKTGTGNVLGLGSLEVFGGDVHVYPVDDYREHRVGQDDGDTCWCGPVRDVECERVVVHRAMDGREEYEDGTKAKH